MQNGDEALPNISPAGRGQLVKMFITLEPHVMFSSNFAYFLTLSGHSHAKRGQGFAEIFDCRPSPAPSCPHSLNRCRLFRYILANTLNSDCTFILFCRKWPLPAIVGAITAGLARTA